MSESCTVIVNSCDDYEDAWYPFFELIKIYWKSRKYPFVLNTETKGYTHNGVCMKEIKRNTKYKNWGHRLLNVLKQIETEYVILLLEDFFLLGEVNQKEIERCIDKMDKNPNIGAIYFKKITGFDSVYDSEYIIMNENKRYKLNLQAGIWKKEILEKLLLENDSPWTFEEEGYKRLEDEFIFLCSSKGSHYDTKDNVFKYLVARNYGYGIWKGKWLWNNEKLFKQHGIYIPKVKMKKMTKIQYLVSKLKKK